MEQKKSYTTSDEILNSVSSENNIILDRTQFKDTPVWIIAREKDYIAVIGNVMIAKEIDVKKITEQLDQIPKLWYTIVAVMADKVTETMLNDIGITTR